MWTHGNIVQVQYPQEVDEIRYDYGTQFIGKRSHDNWFHFAMPTPVIIDDARPQLVKVFVFYNAFSGVTINELRVLDGHRRVKAFENLNWRGDHGFSVHPENSRTIEPPETIFFGLGISVKATLNVGDIDTILEAKLIFTSAGADFKPS